MNESIKQEPSMPEPKLYKRSILKTAIIAAFIDDFLTILLMLWLSNTANPVTGRPWFFLDEFMLLCIPTYVWLFFLPVTLITTWIYRKLKFAIRYELPIISTLGIIMTSFAILVFL